MFTHTVLALALALAACSSANAPAVRSPTTTPEPAANTHATRPEPALPAPWRDLDFRASDDTLAKQFAAMADPGCAQGAYRTSGLCWGSDDRTGDQVITIHFGTAEQAQRFIAGWGVPAFASAGEDGEDGPWRTWHLPAGAGRVVATMVESPWQLYVEELLPLRAAIPLLTSLVGLGHDAVTERLGKRTQHRRPTCEGILCFYSLPPNEAGEVSGSIEFANGVATRVSYSLWCGDACADGPAILAAFDRAFGKRTTATRPYETSGELWTYHTYARVPQLVVKAREHAPGFLFVCVGACD